MGWGGEIWKISVPTSEEIQSTDTWNDITCIM